MINREWIESVALAGLVGWYVGPGILAIRGWMRAHCALWTMKALDGESSLREVKRELRRNRL